MVDPVLHAAEDERDFRLMPPALVEHARRHLRRGPGASADEVPSRDAATVALVRDGVDGLEVYLLRRVASMAFAAGMHVFPGGGVAARDDDPELGWVGPPARWWAGQFGCPEGLARALVCAAVRETFEESGVLLAGASPGHVVGDTDGPEWEADRTALIEHRLTMRDVLRRRRLAVRADLLRPWAHWITPVFEPRRFDTRFFVAALPPGQRTRAVGGEADHVAWLRPGAALRSHQAGELAMLPPTAAVLAVLAELPDVSAVLAHMPRIVPLLPRAVARGDQLGLVLEERPDLRHEASASVPAWTGGPAGSRATCVLAPNPGPMTLDGTNTWLLAEPGADAVVVVDPGPADEAHLQRVLRTATAGGRRVAAVLLTHGHLDHAEGAARFAGLAGAPVRALDPAGRLGEEGLSDGDELRIGGLVLQVVATPGHTGDSLSFLLPADAALLTGDTVLGRGTTVVAHPDGRLGDYLDSLARLQALAADGTVMTLLPGHGPTLPDAAATLERYLSHREERLEQVRAAVAAGDRTATAVVARVYADVDRGLWPAAELSVRAQLDYLGLPAD